jgi:hypothetical protein
MSKQNANENLDEIFFLIQNDDNKARKVNSK